MAGAGKKRPPPWLLVAWLLLLAASGTAMGQSAAEKKELRNWKDQIRQLEFEKKQVQRTLKSFRASEEEFLAKIEKLIGENKAIKSRERELARQRARQQRRRNKQKRRIRELTTEIEKSRERVGGHVRRLYRLSKMRDSANLVSLVRYRDFFRDSGYLRVVIRADQKAIREYEKLGKEFEEQQEAATETLKRLKELKTLLAQEKLELKSSQTALRESLSKLRENRGLYAKYLAELEKTREGMEEALVLLERKSRRRKPPAPLPKPADLRGRLAPPSTGRVIAGFGQRDPRYDLKKFQRGLVIRVAEGAAVSASAAGRIVHAGPFRGYQQLVVIDHGGGLFTVYGHLEKLRVERGGWVQTGAVLGNAAYQPIGAAYDIYFEIRIKGEPEDPLEWLAPGSLGRGSG